MIKIKNITILIFSLILFSFSVYASTLPTGVIAYYNYNTNGTFTDSLGNYNGTIVGTPTYITDGKINGALDYNGNFADYVTIPTAAFSPDYNEPFTLSVWVNPNTITLADNILSTLVSSGTTQGIRYILYDGHPNFVMGNLFSDNLGIYYSGLTVSTSTWTHLVLTYNGNSTASGVSLYVNGALYTGTKTIQQDGLTTTFAHNTVTYLGHDVVYSDSSDMKMDEFGIWNKALTANEVTELFNSNNNNYSYPFTIKNLNVSDNSPLPTLNATVSEYGIYDFIIDGEHICSVKGVGTLSCDVKVPLNYNSTNNFWVSKQGVSSETYSWTVDNYVSLDNNLVAYYSFDSNANNQASGINNGTLTNGAFIDTSTYKLGGGSLSCDGTNDYLAIDDANDNFDFDGDFTINFWTYPRSVASTKLYFSRDFSTIYTSIMMRGDVNIGSGNIYTSSTGTSWHVAGDSWKLPSINTFGMITLTRSGNSLYVYYNGGLNNTISMTSAPKDVSSSFIFCAGQGGYYNNVIFDEIGFWKGRSLTSKEIGILFNDNVGSSYSSMFIELPKTSNIGILDDIYVGFNYDTEKTPTITVTDSLGNIACFTDTNSITTGFLKCTPSEPLKFGETYTVNVTASTPVYMNFTTEYIIDNPFSKYTFDSNFNDTYGNYDFSLTNADISTSNKKIGSGSVYFNANSDKLRVGNLTIGNSKNFSTSFWFYPTNTNTQYIWNLGDAVADSKAFRVSATGQYSFRTQDGTGVTEADSGVTPKLNRWQHVVITYNGTHMKSYINKTLIHNMATTRTLSSAPDLRLGWYEVASLSPIAYYDDMMNFDRVLTTEEIATLYELRNVNMLTNLSGLINITHKRFNLRTNYNSTVNVQMRLINGATTEQEKNVTILSGRGFPEFELYDIMSSITDYTLNVKTYYGTTLIEEFTHNFTTELDLSKVLIIANYDYVGDYNKLDNGVTGTMSGTVNQAGESKCYIGDCLDFTYTVDQAILYGDQDWLEDGSFSHTFWYNMTSANSYPMLIGKYDTGERYHFDFKGTSVNTLHLGLSGTNVFWDVDTDIGTGLNDWYFITWTYNGTHSKIYVNGVLKDTHATVLTPTTNSFHIGAQAGATSLDGQMDEYIGWNKTLTQREINILYNNYENGNQITNIPNYIHYKTRSIENQEVDVATATNFIANITSSVNNNTNVTTYLNGINVDSQFIVSAQNVTVSSLGLVANTNYTLYQTYDDGTTQTTSEIYIFSTSVTAEITYTIQGNVTRYNGNPVSGALVIAVSQIAPYDVLGENISGVDGSWSIYAGTSIGNYSVYAYNATHNDIKGWVVVQ